LALLGVAALLSAAVAAPAAAQEVVHNPGYCAQFYPNANCQNKGPNSPYTGDYQLRNQIRGAYAWGPVPVQWALTSMSAAAAAVTPAIDCETGCRLLAPWRHPSVAIPSQFPFP
jgi:hypothetical protein